MGDRRRPRPADASDGKPWIVERDGDGVHAPEHKPLSSPGTEPGRPFRVLIAVHRPRYRGRAERAASLVGSGILRNRCSSACSG